MISPAEFKQWYKNADLELIAGSHNQEINLDTNLWQGFEVYLHRYKNNNYWDIKRNRFNSKCKVYEIQKRFFSKKYYLSLANAEILSDLDSTDTALIDLTMQKPFVKLMGEKLTGLVEYMNSVASIRWNCLHNIQQAEMKKQALQLDLKDREIARLASRSINLNELLNDIDGADLDVPLEIAPAMFYERYKKIMSNY